MNHWNLIPAQRLSAKRRAASIHRWMLIDGIYVAALVVATIVCVAGNSGTERGSANQVPPAAEIERTNAMASKLRAQSTALQAQLRSASEASNRADWSFLLAAIAGTLGDDTVLNTIDCTPDAGAGSTVQTAITTGATQREFRINGIGRTQESVTRLILAIEALNFFDHVQLLQTAPQPLNGGECVGFQILCSLRGSSGGQ